MIWIGILDEEMNYVGKLAAYLNRKKKGEWRCSAYTHPDVLYKEMEEVQPDMILSTKEEVVEHIRKHYPNVCCVYLTDREIREPYGTDCVYRYQSAAMIVEEADRILKCEGRYGNTEKTAVAVYSPVARCGKTSMLLDYVRENKQRKWLYIGMEDYCGQNGETVDDLLYFVKEKKDEKVLRTIEKYNGIVASPFSLFDTKTWNREDMVWLLEVLKKASGYDGMLFDIGTGVLHHIRMLTAFDKVIVPYVQEPTALVKKDRFIQLVKAYGLEEWTEQIRFLDMKHTNELDALLNVPTY